MAASEASLPLSTPLDSRMSADLKPVHSESYKHQYTDESNVFVGSGDNINTGYNDEYGEQMLSGGDVDVLEVEGDEEGDLSDVGDEYEVLIDSLCSFLQINSR